MTAQPAVDASSAGPSYAAVQSPHSLERVSSTDAFMPPSLQPSSSAYALPEHDTRPSLASPSSVAHHEEDKGAEFPPPPAYKANGTTAAEKVGLALTADPKHAPINEQKEQALATSLSAKPTPVPNSAQAKPDEHEKSEHGALDLTTIPPNILATDPRVGLSSDQVAQRLIEYGYNEIQEHKPSALLKFLSYFTGSIAYLIEAAAILSGALQDWTDFGIITALLLVNAFIGFMEESRAESAVDALKSTLALHCRVMRDGKMVEMEARNIVPGDVISLRTGDVISADAVVLPRVKKTAIYKGLPTDPNAPYQDFAAGHNAEEDHDDQPVELSADQAALTGESLPTMKHPRDLLYSSSIVKTGQALALVIKTGEKTFVGRAANLIAITTDAGHFQKVIQKIGNFLVAITIVMVVIILIVGTTAQGHAFTSQLQNCLVICIASIPVGLPTVLSVTMAVGAKQLAAKQVIVKRLTAVEEMAGIDILCSDKTGTLTKNQLQLDRPYLRPGWTNTELMLYGFLASEHATKDAIDLCLRTEACLKVPVLEGLKADDDATPGFHVLKHEPFTSSTKMATTTLRDDKTKAVFMVAKGAPQVILRMCKLPAADHKHADDAITQMARQGLRALGVSISKPYEGKAPADIKELDWQFIGAFSLLDPPRDDSALTIQRCAEFGISVKMITGDTILIAKEVAKRLGMNRNILSPAIIQDPASAGHGHGHDPTAPVVVHEAIPEKQLIHMVFKADGFGQVVPEDKYRVVELLQNGGHLVGMTGDGVNDAPALKKANVGIAVHGCTDAARAAAAIVLLEPGLGTIADGVMTSRAIFQRMRSYSLYRITSTIHFLLFLFIAIIAFDFTIPAVLIVLITVMNDAATLVISVDNAQISKRPDKWRIGQLIFLSFVLAILLAIASFGHFFIFKYALSMGDGPLGTVMYLQMSSCPHFVIFSTRLPGPFWVKPPSLIFFIAVMGTQVIAMFFAIYGVLSDAIGWPSSVAIMSVSLVYFMFLDQVKLIVYKYWNYELTVKMWPTAARRKVRAEKRALKATADRFARGARVGRRLIHAAMFVNGARGIFNLEQVQVVVKKDVAGLDKAVDGASGTGVPALVKGGESFATLMPKEDGTEMVVVPAKAL